MALASDQKIIEDTGSEVVKEVRLSHNKVLVALEALITETEAAATFAALQSAVTANIRPLVDAMRQIVADPELPERPKKPTV